MRACLKGVVQAILGDAHSKVAMESMFGSKHQYRSQRLNFIIANRNTRNNKQTRLINPATHSPSLSGNILVVRYHGIFINLPRRSELVEFVDKLLHSSCYLTKTNFIRHETHTSC